MQTNIVDKRSIVDNPSLSMCLYYVRTRKNNKIWVKVEHKRAIYQKIEHYYHNNSNDNEHTIDVNSHTYVWRCLSNMNEHNDTSSSSSLSVLTSNLDTQFDTLHHHI